jgi:hypothetical protein
MNYVEGAIHSVYAYVPTRHATAMTPSSFYVDRDASPNVERINRFWFDHDPTPKVTPVADLVSENRFLKGVNEQHENEIAVLTRALRMAKSKIERLEAAARPPEPVKANPFANALKADRLLDAYGR